MYEGSYWSSTVRRHVRFESLLERDWLVSADFDPDAVAFQWQPFVLKWPRGTKSHRSHVPDFFCRVRSGDGVVVDVKRPDRFHDSKVSEQFEMTREVCSSVGWHYEVFSGPPEPAVRTWASWPGSGRIGTRSAAEGRREPFVHPRTPVARDLGGPAAIGARCSLGQ